MARLWATSDDGKFKYFSLTDEYLKGALKSIRSSFYKYETVSQIVGLTEQPGAVDELEELTLRTARDGVSLVAVDVATDEVCAVAFNKIQVKCNADDGTYFDNFAKSCQYESSRVLVEFMRDADGNCDLFELCNVDCLLEIMFLSTSKGYENNGIGTKLCELSLRLVQELKQGTNVKVPVNGATPQLEPIPKMAAAIFTSTTSQKIGRKLNFTIAFRESFDRYLKNVGPDRPEFTLEYKLIS